MFEISDNKVFMDSVHGYISVPKCFVKHIIDTEMFQRLRNIDQTGMRILYPDAKHDRYGHSLGVYYLGCKAVDALLENFSKDIHWRIRSDNKMLVFWAENKILFMLACLLHDIGHVPFSHSLEDQVLRNSCSEYNRYEFGAKLAERINLLEKDDKEAIEGDMVTAAPHEQLGAMYILEHMRENIEKVYDDLIALEYPNLKSDSILYAENYDGKIVLSKNNLDKDLCFIARMIMGLKYKSYTPEKQIRNCFIELLNSGNFDVDKLDYILRDTQMSGIANINVDVERLLGAINIVTKTVYRNQKDFQKQYTNVTIHELDNSNNSAGKIRLNGRMKGRIRIFPEAEVRIREGSGFDILHAENSGCMIIACPDSSEITYFSEETEIYQNGEKIKARNGKTPLGYNNDKEYQCFIKNASIIEKDFLFQVCEREKVMELSLDGECDVTISGKCSTKDKGVIVADGMMEIEGAIDKLVILGDCLQDCMPIENAYHEFSVGYKKQAMNVIANVLEARDYLYLWIYAHHKVTYYANYLVPVLAKTIFNQRKMKTLPWNLNYNDILKLDDYYVWTGIKMYAMEKTPHENQKLCQELLSRQYRKSAYKSLAEYDLIFENFSDEDKRAVKSHFQENLVSALPFLESDGEKTAGYISAAMLRELKKYAKKHNLKEIARIKSIVFVAVSYKSRVIDPHKTLILIGDRIVAMEEIPLLRERCSLTQQGTSHYFYLYYELSDDNSQNDFIMTQEIKQLLRVYFTDVLKVKRP